MSNRFTLTVTGVSGTALIDVIATGMVVSLEADPRTSHMYTVTVGAPKFEQLDILRWALCRAHDPRKVVHLSDIERSST